MIQLTKTLCDPATRYEVIVSPVGDLIGRKPGTVTEQQASAKEQQVRSCHDHHRMRMVMSALILAKSLHGTTQRVLLRQKRHRLVGTDVFRSHGSTRRAQPVRRSRMCSRLQTGLPACRVARHHPIVPGHTEQAVAPDGDADGADADVAEKKSPWRTTWPTVRRRLSSGQPQ